MAIRVYSDKTKQFYNTVEEANHAEFELKEKENLAKIEAERKERELKAKKEQAAVERKAAAEKVEAARKAYVEAQKTYRAELESFCKKYGTYHYSTNGPEDIPTLFGFLSDLFQL